MDIQVLVADDDIAMRQMLVRLLTTTGVTDILEAADGDEALMLAVTHERTLDLLFLDWQMPGKDGIAIARALRAAGCHTPIVMVTGEARQAAVKEAVQAGVTAYIVKPFTPEKVIEETRRILDGVRVKKAGACYRVKNAMNNDVITIRASARAEEAIPLLLENSITGLPVLDEADRLVGMITEYELLQALLRPEVGDMTVSDLMTTELLVVNEETLISDAVRILREKRVRQLPVVRDGKLIGSLSRREALKHFAEHRETLTAFFDELKELRRRQQTQLVQPGV